LTKIKVVGNVDDSFRGQINPGELDMIAYDVMTENLITATPDTPVSEIARLLVNHRIGAVPIVTSNGALVGIVSQTDLAHRSETDTQKRRKWWLELFADPNAQAREYIKTHGLLARDVMTTVIISIAYDASLADVAEALDTHHVRQLPVMRNGRMAGIVSKTDLVRAVAQSAKKTTEDQTNGELQKALWNAIRGEPWLQSAFLNLTVKDGVLELYGAVQSPDQRRAVLVLVKGVAGVRDVIDNLSVMPRVVAV
jgi:CBS domain-containing protein